MHIIHERITQFPVLGAHEQLSIYYASQNMVENVILTGFDGSHFEF